MSRARRAVRVKPATVDGFKFASGPEALRYENLKSLAGGSFKAEPSQDGRMLVCTWSTTRGQMAQGLCLAQSRRNKFNAVKTPVGELMFASGLEARRFIQLTYMQAAGEIRDLVHHPPSYEFVVNGVRIGQYTPDFIYTVVATNERIIEDSKSEATRKARDWPLRKKLMLACHGIDVQEVHGERR
jgi:hypothetical protein